MAGNNTTTITGVTNIEHSHDGDTKRIYVDNNLFARGLKQTSLTRMVRITGASMNLYAAILQNAVGTLTWVENDSINGVGSGALTWTMINATLLSNNRTNQTQEYSSSELTFEAFSADGTEPLTYAQAS